MGFKMQFAGNTAHMYLMKKLTRNVDWLSAIILLISLSSILYVSRVSTLYQHFAEDLFLNKQSKPSEAFNPDKCSDLTVYRDINDVLANPEKICRYSAAGQNLTDFPDKLLLLTNLEILDLHGNRLTSLPDGLENLKKLKEIDLGDNLFTEMPPVLTKLASLAKLELGFNRLTGIPLSIGELKQLNFLSLNRNQLASLPDSMGDLENLKSLELTGNQLKDLPANLNRVPIRELYLNDNLFSEIPSVINGLKNLEVLHMKNNPFKEAPQLPKLPLLQQIELPSVF